MSDAPPALDAIHIEAEAAHPRLDRFLAAAHPAISRTRWKSLIEDGRVTIDGDIIHKSNTSVPAGAVIECHLPPPNPIGLVPVDIPLDILYEDADLIAINKPPGLVVHPAPGHETDTVVNALLHYCRDLQGIGGELRPGIVHRLDKDTSGVLVVAKNEQTLAALVEQFSAHTVEKEYRTLVWGKPAPPSGTISKPIGRHPVHRQKMAVTEKGRAAVTHYQTLAAGGMAAHLLVRIETGRTHQIRVHMASIGHPVAGDAVYGRARHGLPPELALPRQMLHARRLVIRHPRTGAALDFTAPLPDDFTAACNVLAPS